MKFSFREEAYVICRPEKDWFPLNGQWIPSRKKNKYYHCRHDCLVRRNPIYDQSLIEVGLSFNVGGSEAEVAVRGLGF